MRQINFEDSSIFFSGKHYLKTGNRLASEVQTLKHTVKYIDFQGKSPVNLNVNTEIVDD